MIKIGSRGLAEVEIIIPNGCSLQFKIIHKDSAGNVIDHSASKLHFAMQGSKTYVLDEFCSANEQYIFVNIPASFTQNLPDKTMLCDFIAETDAYSECLFYGTAKIEDTYAKDI